MGYRFRKQLMVIGIIVLFFVAVGVAVYFVKYRPAPSCFDKIINQGEQDVDCGGPCMSCERLTIKDINVDSVGYLKLNAGRYDLYAKITNPNPNFGLAVLNYTFLLKNSSGQVIKEQKGTSFILSHQGKYIIEAGVSLTQEVSAVNLEIEKTPPENWSQLSSNLELPNIYVLNKVFQLADGQTGVSQISGNIKNDSAFDLDQIVVSIVLFDSNNQIIGVNKTEARTVLAGEERYFSAQWFSPLNKNAISSIIVEAQTNLLSNENFISKFVVPEKFQQYGPATSK